MIWIWQLYMLIYKLFLAGKDATSYLLKSKTEDDLTNTRLTRWHRDGVILDTLMTIPVACVTQNIWWQVVIQSILLRLAFYDIAFNHWGNLEITYLGGTAYSDKTFVKIFGAQGAIKKAIVSFSLLILFDLSKIIFKY